MAYNIIVMNIRDPIPQGYFGIPIMRPHVLGNPFFLSDENNREKVIAQYKQYLWDHMQDSESHVTKALLHYAQTANDIALICCCSPKACHGDVIKAAIEWIRNNRMQMPMKQQRRDIKRTNF